MGDRYVEITKGEMEKFIKNSYRPYRPKPGRVGDMLTYTLQLSSNVGLKIHTSLSFGHAEVRGVGEDAIEVFLVSRKFTGRKEYLMTRASLRKAGIALVMRTKNWRSALDDRVDKLLDMYEENTEYWENRATQETQEGPSPAQLKYLQTLVDRIGQRQLQTKVKWVEFGFDGRSRPTNFSHLTPGKGGTASQLIDTLTKVLENTEVQNEHDRELNDSRGRDEPKEPAIAPQPAGTTATFKKLRDDKTWGIQGQNLVEGTWVSVLKKNGQSIKLPVGRIIYTSRDGYTVAEITRSRRAGDESFGLADDDLSPPNIVDR